MSRVRLQGLLSLDNSPFLRTLQNSSRSAAAFARNTARMVGRAALVGVAALAAGVTVAAGVMAVGIRRAIDYASEIDHLARTAGIAAGTTAVMVQAMEDFGINSKALTTGTKTLSRAIVEGERGVATYAREFEKLGLSTAELLAMSPDEQMFAVANAIQALGTQAERTNAATQLLGRQGAGLVQAFESGAIQDAAAVLGSQVDILARRSGDMEEAATRFSRIGNQIRGFFLGVADVLLDTILPILRFINNIDFARFGIQFGEALQTAVNILMAFFENPGPLLSAFWDVFTAGAARGLRFVVTGLLNAASDMWEAFQQITRGLGDLLGNAIFQLGPLMRDSFKPAINGIIAMLGNGLLDMFANVIGFVRSQFDRLLDPVINTLNKIPGVNISTAGGARSQEEHTEDARAAFSTVSDIFGQMRKDAEDDMGKALLAFADSNAEMLDKVTGQIKKFVQGSEDEDAFGEALDNLKKVAGEMSARGEEIMTGFMDSLGKVAEVAEGPAERGGAPVRTGGSMLDQDTRIVGGVRKRGETREQFDQRMGRGAEEQDTEQEMAQDIHRLLEVTQEAWAT